MKSIANYQKSFPAAQYHPKHQLLTWRPEGVLDDELADRVIDFLEFEEASDEGPFHRYSDLSRLTRVQLSLDHVFTLAKRRTRAYRGPRVKSAFYAIRLITLTIAKMYEELMAKSRIEVRVFRDRAAAASWLEVPAKVLAAPPAEEW